MRLMISACKLHNSGLGIPYDIVKPSTNSVGRPPSGRRTSRANLERPKSASFNLPRKTRMLSGLMSACQLRPLGFNCRIVACNYSTYPLYRSGALLPRRCNVNLCKWRIAFATPNSDSHMRIISSARTGGTFVSSAHA